MSGNTFGKLFQVTTYGESHGKALGCIIDGCPPQLEISTDDIQSVPLVIDPPNDGNYTISFTGLDERRKLIGANGAAAGGGLRALGDYMLCLSLTPMCEEDLRNFYPQERGYTDRSSI